MILGRLLRAARWTVGIVQSVGECLSSGARLVRQMRNGTVLMPDETDPFPLEQRPTDACPPPTMRSRHATMRPPPPSSRYD